MRAILEALGSGLDRVVQLTVYLADMAPWSELDRVVGRFFGSHRPARAVIPTHELHHEHQIEVQAIATTRSGRRARA